MKVSVVAGLVLGTALWLGLVVSDRPDAEPRVAAAWWVMAVVALLMGVALGTGYGAVAGLVLGVTQFVLWVPTGPKGDNDGLQLLWVPTLLFATLVYAGLAEVGGRLRARWARSERHLSGRS